MIMITTTKIMMIPSGVHGGLRSVFCQCPLSEVPGVRGDTPLWQWRCRDVSTKPLAPTQASRKDKHQMSQSENVCLAPTEISKRLVTGWRNTNDSWAKQIRLFSHFNILFNFIWWNTRCHPVNLRLNSRLESMFDNPLPTSSNQNSNLGTNQVLMWRL